MDNEKLVSVIMSTLHTKKEYLKEAIDSILNQSYKNIEFIIIVDGGNDDEFIYENYSDNRIKVIKHQETIGLPSSLNEAMDVANGDYIARMDSDDISMPNRIYEQVKYMENHLDIDITSTYYQQIGASHKKVKEKQNNYTQVKCKLFFINNIAHPSVMFRKKSIEEKQIHYDEAFVCSQDYELWTRDQDVKIEIVPILGLKYRIHNNQVSNSKKKLQFDLYCQVLKRNLSTLGIDICHLDNILVLNGKKKMIEANKLYEFVLFLIERNHKYKIYDDYEFEKILMQQYEKCCIKNKKILHKNFLVNMHYLLK